MSIVRYEELDLLAGELLPERTLLGVLRFMMPSDGGYGGGGGYQPEHSPHQECHNDVRTGYDSSSGILSGLGGGALSVLNDEQEACQNDSY